MVPFERGGSGLILFTIGEGEGIVFGEAFKRRRVVG
jgi:hypothetical protein